MVLMAWDGQDTQDTSPGAAQFMILINSSDVTLGTQYTGRPGMVTGCIHLFIDSPG